MERGYNAKDMNVPFLKEQAIKFDIVKVKQSCVCVCFRICRIQKKQEQSPGIEKRRCRKRQAGVFSISQRSQRDMEHAVSHGAGHHHRHRQDKANYIRV